MPPTVLLVDDDEGITRALIKALAPLGVELSSVADGEAAARFLDESPPDLAVIDMLLPKVSGFNLAKKISAAPYADKTKKIIISGVYSPNQIKESILEEYGISAFLPKPFQPAELRRIVAEVLALPENPPAGKKEEAGKDGESAPPAEEAEAAAYYSDAEILPALDGAAFAEKGFSGGLEKISFAAIVFHIYLKNATGVLTIQDGRYRKQIHFRDGRPVNARSNKKDERLGEVLLRNRVITQEQFDHVSREMTLGGYFGDICVDLGYAGHSDIHNALLFQAFERVEKTFSQKKADFSFEERVDWIGRVEEHPIIPERVVAMGVKKFFGVERLKQAMASRTRSVPVLLEKSFELLNNFEFTDAENSFIMSLQGRETVRDCLAAKPAIGAGRAMQILYMLFETGLAAPVETKERRPVKARAAASAEKTEPSAGTEAPDPAVADAPLAAEGAVEEKAASPAAPKGAELEKERVARRIREKYESLQKTDYYAILEAPQDAGRAEIRKAYFKLAKEFHPDAVSALGLGDAASMSGEVFSSLSVAYETLSDEEKRVQYDELLADKSKGAGHAAPPEAQASVEFQKAQVHAKKKNLPEAEICLRKAVELQPENENYLLHLGWRLYEQESKAKRIEGKDLIFRVYESNAKSDSANFFLGLVFKAENKPDRAVQRFQRALELNEKHPQAKEELKRLSRCAGQAGRGGKGKNKTL